MRSTNSLAITALILLFASLSDSNSIPAEPRETPAQTTCKCSDCDCCQCDETIKALEARIAKLEGMMGGLNDTMPIPPEDKPAPEPPKDREGYPVTRSNGYISWEQNGVTYWVQESLIPEDGSIQGGLTYRDGYVIPNAPMSQSARSGRWEAYSCGPSGCKYRWVED